MPVPNTASPAPWYCAAVAAEHPVVVVDHCEPAALIRLLADGRFHSGTALGSALKIGRGAVWKRMRALADYGLDVQRLPGRGYRLAAPLDLLDEACVRAPLAPAHARRLGSLSILSVVDSTNRWLGERAAEFSEGEVGACLAEYQTAGRGRRGRRWVSPFGANLYLSVAWHLHDLPPAPAALSLAAGLAVAGGLTASGFPGVGVKWPNDLVWQDRKLGGVLVDLQGQPAGACRLVVGVGINVAMPPRAAADITQPWVDLAALGETPAGLRSRLAGCLVDALMAMVEHYTEAGFAAFMADWHERDAIAGREVSLLLPEGTATGTAAGVDIDGALRLRVDGEIRRYTGGEISLRLVR